MNKKTMETSTITQPEAANEPDERPACEHIWVTRYPEAQEWFADIHIAAGSLEELAQKIAAVKGYPPWRI